MCFQNRRHYLCPGCLKAQFHVLGPVKPCSRVITDQLAWSTSQDMEHDSSQVTIVWQPIDKLTGYVLGPCTGGFETEWQPIDSITGQVLGPSIGEYEFTWEARDWATGQKISPLAEPFSTSWQPVSKATGEVMAHYNKNGVAAVWHPLDKLTQQVIGIYEAEREILWQPINAELRYVVGLAIAGCETIWQPLDAWCKNICSTKCEAIVKAGQERQGKKQDQGRKN